MKINKLTNTIKIMDDEGREFCLIAVVILFGDTAYATRVRGRHDLHYYSSIAEALDDISAALGHDERREVLRYLNPEV